MISANRNCILRLCRYKNALYRFRALGFSKIFSDYIAEAIGVSSALVRKDFSNFDISGNKRGGYGIDDLLANINAVLGKDTMQNVILAGAGNLGSALIKYKNFEKEGIKIVAAFDLDPAKLTAKSGTRILRMKDMSEYITTHKIEIGIITVPEIAAQEVLDIMAAAGIRGVLNFSPIQLKAPKTCIVHDVNLALELENLVYFVRCGKENRTSG
jgi:redox-sensing transcriptional repressor